MASLIEELITTLEEENRIYQALIPISENKTNIIINNDLIALNQITEEEQSLITVINGLENKRQEVIVNIGTVMNQNPDTLDLKMMVKLLDKQPEEQKKISQIHDELRKTIERLMELNFQNQSLLEQSLELVEFNMNFIQSTRVAPGNNYTKNASGMDLSVDQTRIFDAKQ
ncbi:MAG: flagellar protein FlgN [Acetivibrio sp.]